MNTTEQTTPDLDQALMDGLSVFDGAPVNADTDEPAGQGEAGPAAGEHPGGESTPPPDGREATNDPAAMPADQAEAMPKPRFKSHAEAEEGYRHLQREKTIADQRAKVLEAELLQIKNAEKRRQEESQEDEEFEAYATQRHMQALADIDALDPDDPDYKKKVAAAWARSQRDIRRWQSVGADKNTGAGAPGETAIATHPAPGAEGKGVAAAADDVARVRSYANEFIVREGLPADDPLFWTFAASAPATDEKGKELPLDDQIRWAISQTKNYHATILGAERRRQEEAATARGRDAALRAMPLGRSAAERPPAGSEPATPISLADALDSALEQRRL